MTAELGYLHNAAFTISQGDHSSEDDKFAIQAEIQLSDHLLTTDGATFDAVFSIKVADFILASKSNVLKYSSMRKCDNASCDCTHCTSMQFRKRSLS